MALVRTEGLALAMIKQSITPQDAVNLLNGLLACDRDAIADLFDEREPCNDALVNHPSVQVRMRPNSSVPTVGVLGILNGLFGTFEGGLFNGWGPIMLVTEDDGSPRCFAVVNNDPPSIVSNAE